MITLYMHYWADYKQPTYMHTQADLCFTHAVQLAMQGVEVQSEATSENYAFCRKCLGHQDVTAEQLKQISE